jgi:hypothetical protein
VKANTHKVEIMTGYLKEHGLARLGQQLENQVPIVTITNDWSAATKFETAGSYASRGYSKLLVNARNATINAEGNGPIAARARVSAAKCAKEEQAALQRLVLKWAQFMIFRL